jgi:hypothetical protein
MVGTTDRQTEVTGSVDQVVIDLDKDGGAKLNGVCWVVEYIDCC